MALPEIRLPHAGSRVIVLDTETTGLDPSDGHRVVEVACVELVNLMPTGRELHFYCDPERDMPEDAQAIHGLSREFLAGHPPFGSSAAEFTAFMGDAVALVAHNAEFDVRFLNAELRRAGLAAIACAVVDTLAMARRKFPGAPASLDALCRRFGIDLSERTKHGALIDTKLLARVYLELMGGLQPDLGLATQAAAIAGTMASGLPRVARKPRTYAPDEAELAAHQAMLAGLKDPLWLAS